MAKFDPSQIRDPLANRQRNTWLRPRDDPRAQNFAQITHGANVWNMTIFYSYMHIYVKWRRLCLPM